MTIVKLTEKLGRIVDSGSQLTIENSKSFAFYGFIWGFSQFLLWFFVSLLEEPWLSAFGSGLLISFWGLLAWCNAWTFILCAREPKDVKIKINPFERNDSKRSVLALMVFGLLTIVLLAVLVVPIILAWVLVSWFVAKPSQMAWFSVMLSPIFLVFLITTVYLSLRSILFWPLMSSGQPDFSSAKTLLAVAWRSSRGNLIFLGTLSALHGSLLCLAFALGTLSIEHPTFRPDIPGQMQAVWPELFRSQSLSVGLGCLFMQPILAFVCSCWHKVIYYIHIDDKRLS